MQVADRRSALAPWLASMFCAALSLITIVAQFWLVSVNGGGGWGWSIPFLCFLPMCFFFVGMTVKHLQDQVADLQRQLSDLRSEKQS